LPCSTFQKAISTASINGEAAEPMQNRWRSRRPGGTYAAAIMLRASHRRTSFMALGGRARQKASGFAVFDLSKSHFHSIHQWRGRGAHAEPVVCDASRGTTWLRTA